VARSSNLHYETNFGVSCAKGAEKTNFYNENCWTKNDATSPLGFRNYTYDIRVLDGSNIRTN
jgi:hypothetical protein